MDKSFFVRRNAHLFFFACAFSLTSITFNFTTHKKRKKLSFPFDFFKE